MPNLSGEFLIKYMPATLLRAHRIARAHRHPFPTATSACSLLRAMHELYFEREGFVPEEIGRRITDYCSDTLNAATAEINATGLDCAHVVFSELTKDPVAMMRNIYAQFGWDFSKEYQKNLCEYLAADEKKRQAQFEKAKGAKAKIHNPELYHLDKDIINKKFADYIDLYGMLWYCYLSGFLT